MLENNWTNPFSNQLSDLVNLATGAAAPPNVSTDLLKACEKGKRSLQVTCTEVRGGFRIL
jgi:hypothetical protein